MCGIAGLVWKTQTGRRVEDFRNAAALMAHRGPDGYGEFIDEKVFLIHYRLAILDLSSAGQQPFEVEGEDGSVGVYNGELYNYRELASSWGIQQSTSCDTEVVFKSLAQHGTRILADYNGIFALAQYFPRDGHLLLARDRLGVKPLYMVDTPEFFAFASEAKVLYAFLEALEIDPRVLHEFLCFGSSMSMDTIIKGVEKLPPGTFLSFDLTTRKIHREAYWTLSEQVAQAAPTPSYGSVKESIKILLSEAVKRQCLSDVPIGAYLSGGLDSSIIVALAAQQSGSVIKTFSAQFEGSSNSELPLAQLVAQRYDTDHHEMNISTRNIESDLRGLILQYDEPFADPAALPLHLMAAKCSPMAKVVLQGDGGDELFAGYGRHLDMSQLRRRQLAFGLLSRFHPDAKTRKGFKSRFEPLSATPLAVRLSRLTADPDEAVLASVFKTSFGQSVMSTSPSRTFEIAAGLFRNKDPVSQVLLTDMLAILPHTFLEKVDKVSMWHGVEARVPMLDNALVDYVIGLPSNYKIRGGVTKALLRDVATDLLPAEVVSGRKQSFGTPIDIWLRTLLFAFAQQVFREGRNNWGHLFDFDRILALHKEHVECKCNHSGLLWRLVVLLVWLDHYKGKMGSGEFGPSAKEQTGSNR